MSDLTLVLGPDWSRFSKRITIAADSGELSYTAADQLPRLLEFEDCDVNDIRDLFEILSLLRGQRNTCVIRGQLLPGAEQPCRRLLTPRTEDGVRIEATFAETARSWLMIDLDSVAEPEGLNFAAEPARSADLMRSLLPLPFRSAACVWRASGSAGFKPGIRLHLWFLLSRPLLGAECKAWLSHADVKTDRAPYSAVQPHFTADPDLVGVDDPMAERIGLLSGDPRVLVPVEIPKDMHRAAVAPQLVHVEDTRSIDPFLRSALNKWDKANPWDVEPDLSTRFECPACGSSDGCAVLPDGKLFCHGGKHTVNAPNIGHPANNGFVMTRFEAYERIEWSQVTSRLQELGFYPGLPKRVTASLTAAQSETVDDVVDAVSAAMTADTETLQDVDLGKVRRARKELKELVDIARTDPKRLGALTFAFARKHVPNNMSAEALRNAMLAANSSSRNAGAAMLDTDALTAVDDALKRAAGKPFVEQPSALAKDMYGKLEKCLSNVVKLIGLEDVADCVAWDVRSRRVVVTQAPCWQVEDAAYPRMYVDSDSTSLTRYLADRHDYPWATTGQIAEAITYAAVTQPIDPVYTYLEELPKFEGSLEDARLLCGSWLIEFAGAADSEYVRAVSMRWLIAAIARTYRPGCKAREVLTLIGPQDKGKSYLLEKLCGQQWFKDDLKVDKETGQALLGKWIIELAELDKVVKTDRHGELKAFISTSQDNYRMPWGRFYEDVPRRSLPAATANVMQLFRDPTGNTRFNVVVVSDNIDHDGVAAVRDELWAAARMLFKASEQWWLTEHEKVEARRLQEAHREVFDAEILLKEALQPFTLACPVQGLNVGTQCVVHRESVVDETGKAREHATKHIVWITTVQLMTYLRDQGVTKGSQNKQIAECMQRLGWISVRHASGSRHGGRGYHVAGYRGKMTMAEKSELAKVLHTTDAGHADT